MGITQLHQLERAEETRLKIEELEGVLSRSLAYFKRSVREPGECKVYSAEDITYDENGNYILKGGNE